MSLPPASPMEEATLEATLPGAITLRLPARPQASMALPKGPLHAPTWLHLALPLLPTMAPARLPRMVPRTTQDAPLPPLASRTSFPSPRAL
jgi:hypothetical protein